MKRGNDYAAGQKFNEATIEYLNALKIDPNFGDAEVALGNAYHELGDHPRASKAYARAADLLPDDIDIQIRAGSMRLLAHNFLDARTLAERVLQRDPKNIVAQLLRANALAGLDDIETAVKQIEDAIGLDPKRAELYTNLGTVQAAGANRPEAEAAFKKAIEIAPTDSRPFAALGNFYWSSSKFAEAERAFLKAVEVNPKDKLANRSLATFYMASGRPQDAERFLRAVAAEGNDLNAGLRLADFLILIAKKDEGVALLRDLAKRQEGYAPATTRLAAVLYGDGRKDEAHKMVDEVVARNKSYAPAVLVQARFAYFEGKSTEAMAKAQTAITIDPRLESAHYLIAQLHQSNGDLTAAMTSLKTVLQINSRASAAQMDLAQLNAAAGKIDVAVTLADSAVTNSRGSLDYRLKLVRLLFAKGDLERADAELVALRKQFPQNAPVLAASGGLAILKRDVVSARRYFEQALRLSPEDFDAASGLVAVELMAGHPDAARQRVEDAMKQRPNSQAMMMLTARTYGATGDLPKAEDTLKKAINIDPTNTDAYGMLGQLLFQQGRLDDGRKEFEKVVSQQPKDVAALTMLAIIASRQGQTAAAIGRYEQVLAIDPEAAMAANNLAYLYAEAGRNLDKAIELATTAQKRMPDEPSANDTLGWAYVKKGLAQVGVRYLRTAVEKSPQDPTIRYHLGVALAQLKDSANATTELQRALKLNRDFKNADEAQRLLETLGKKLGR